MPGLEIETAQLMEDLISDLTSVPEPVVIKLYSQDPELLRGWAPQVAFADGLRATVDWYRGNRWWWEPIKHNDPAFKAYYQAQYETRTGA